METRQNYLPGISPQSGVGLIGLIILLAALGAIGYYAWQTFGQSTPAGSSTPSVKTPINQAKDSVKSIEQKNNSNPY